MTTTTASSTIPAMHTLEDLTIFGLIYPEVIRDLKRALAELNASPFQVTFATTGLGAIMNTLIWGLGGCSKTLRNSLFTYDSSSTIELVGRELKSGEFTIPPTASGMSAATLFKSYQRLFKGGEIDKVPYLIGAGMCGAVQTCRKRNGLDIAQMSFRVLRNGLVQEWTMSLELDKNYTRGWQDIFASLVFLNGILHVAGIDQIHLPATPLLRNVVVSFIEDHLQITPTLYNLPSFTAMIKAARGITEHDNRVICTPERHTFSFGADRATLASDGAIVVNPDGSVTKLANLTGKLVSVSTSANPLSPLHFLLMREGNKAVEDGIPVLELCLGNPDKGEISIEEIEARVAQAHGLCHVIVRTGSGMFIDKVAPFQQHIVGIDTAVRILNPGYYGPKDATPAERLPYVQAMLAKFAASQVTFYVVERCGYKLTYDQLIEMQPAVYRDLARQLFQHLYTGTKGCAVSSTDMRNAEKAAATRS